MEPASTRRRRLGSSPLCRGLSDGELDEILLIAEDRIVAKGELSLFGGGHKRSASAKAESEVLVVRIPTRAFRKLLEVWNVAAMKIVCNLTEQLAERMMAINDKLVAATKATKAAPLQMWRL